MLLYSRNILRTNKVFVIVLLILATTASTTFCWILSSPSPVAPITAASRFVLPKAASSSSSSVTTAKNRFKSTSVITMNGGGGKLLDVANFAVQQSPTSTKFVTNKMCPFAQKVWIALEAAGAPYEMTEVELYGPGGKPDWFWELNPDGTVPVLVCHGGAVVLPDSDVALDQIANGSAVNIGEKSSGSNQNDSLSAVDEKKDAKLLKSIDQWRTSINNMLPIGKKAVLGGKKDKLFDILQEMDDRVVGPYLCGEKVTVADCAAFPFLWRLNDEFGLDKYRNLISWLKTCNAKPAFSKTVQSSWWWWW